MGLSGPTLLASIDVVIRMLADPSWKRKADRIKTKEDLRQLLVEFCEAKGKVVWVDSNTAYLYPLPT